MKIMVIDGNSMVNRAFYGVRPLTNSAGLNTNAIYGFLTIYLKLLEDEKPDGVCIAFDMRSPTFRHKEYSEYKAQRKPMPEDLVKQFPIAKDILRAMNVPLLELPGYEADDIIGTVCALCEKENIKFVLQIVKNNASMYNIDILQVLLIIREPISKNNNRKQ